MRPGRSFRNWDTFAIGRAVVEVPTGDFVGRGIYIGAYERAETKLVQCLVGAGAVCVDVGANLGFYDALLASFAGSSGTVAAIEPNPKLIPLLSSNLRDIAVELVEDAIDPEHSEATLAITPGNLGMSSLKDNTSGEHR